MNKYKRNHIYGILFVISLFGMIIFGFIMLGVELYNRTQNNKIQKPYIYIDCNSYEMEEVFERMAEIEAYVKPVEG